MWCVLAYMHPLEFMCVHNMSCFVHVYQSITYVVRVIFCVCEGLYVLVCIIMRNYDIYCLNVNILKAAYFCGHFLNHQVAQFVL